MALQKIFLADPIPDWERVGNSMSTFYRFDGSTLTIRWKDGKHILEENSSWYITKFSKSGGDGSPVG